MDSREDYLTRDNTMDCLSDTNSDKDDMHPDIPKTQNDFEELLRKSDSDSNFVGFE